MTREEEIIKASQLYAKAYQKPFLDGAKWADKTMIDKACEWLENFCNEHYIMSYSDCNEVVTKELMEIFIKKMEE